MRKQAKTKGAWEFAGNQEWVGDIQNKNGQVWRE